MITFVDLETCFLRKGKRRIHQQILEIGMCRGKDTFQCLVNPCGDNPIVQGLKDMGQDPEKTIHFWTKLLVGKKILNTNVKKKDMQGRADAIRTVTKDMLSPSDAIRKAHAFGMGTWVAHNGKSFDFHILRAHMDRSKLDHPTFMDSLPILRRELDLVSYSQPLVYKSLFKDTYKAHHALHDAQALQKIWDKVKPNTQDEHHKHKHKHKHKSELLDIYGVGPKSVQELHKHGIYTVEELAKAARAGKTFKVVRKSVLKLLAVPKIKLYADSA